MRFPAHHHAGLRKAGVAGAGGTAAVALGRAEASAALGMIAGPIGSIFDGRAGGLMGAVLGGAAGSAAGERTDTHLLV